MRSWRFLLTRRWVLFLLVVVLLTWATYLLGRWQFHRLEERKASNAVVRTNEHAAPTPVDQVMAVGRPLSADDEWRVITATGTYDTSQTVVVRYTTHDGDAGVDVVVPLVTSSGAALLVDRGWFATENQGTSPSDVPAPPSGRVTVTGWARVDATGSSTQVTDHSVRSVSSSAIGPAVGHPVYGGFVDLKDESPAPATPLLPAELPDLGNGPHFFYGLQWWFFGLLAVFGFCYLAWDERRGGHASWVSQRSRHASVDGEDGPGDEGRGRAQQESSRTTEL